MKTPDTPVEHITFLLDKAKASLVQSEANKATNDYISKALELSSGLDRYLNYLNIDDNHPVLSSIHKFTFETDWHGLHETHQTSYLLSSTMIVDKTELNFLNLLQRLINAKSLLEIGMFTGYTTLSLALNSHPDSIVHAIEREPYLVSYVKKQIDLASLSNKIKIFNEDAEDVLNLIKEPYDFIFIDADKAKYLTYFNIILNKRLLSAHGMICIDNTLMKGSVYCDAVPDTNAFSISTFNEALKADARITYVVLPIRDGLTLVKWK